MTPRCHGRISALLVVLIIFVNFENASAQDATSILNSYYRAVSNGDVQKWKNIKSAYIESTVSYSSSIASNGTPDLMNTKMQHVRFYRVWPDLMRRDLYEDSVLVSSHFSIRQGDFLIMANREPIATSPGPYERSFEFMPVTIQNTTVSSKRVRYIGIRELEGKKFYELEVVTKHLTWKFFFDETTFLLGYWSNSSFGDFTTLTKVFNYKEIDGLMFPMSEIKSRNGIAFFWEEVRLIELNKEIDPEIFEYRPK